MTRQAKTKVTITIDLGLVEWINKEVKKFTFQSRSHAVEQAVYRLKQEMEKKNTS